MKNTLLVSSALLLLATAPALADNRGQRVELTVAGMACEGCASSVEQGLGKLGGVTAVDIDIDTRRVVVKFDAQKTSRKAIEARIAELGYVVGTEDPPVRYPKGADVAVVSKRGENVDVTKHLAPGKVTVVDFYADWCKPCKALERRLARRLGKHPDKLAVRKVNIISWESPAAKRYLKKVPGLPYIRIYDGKGRLVVALHGDRVDKLDGYLKRAWRRSVK